VSDYTLLADVQSVLPDGYSTTVLPDATVNTKITAWSGFVNDALPRYWAFNDTTDTPTTPKSIREITTWLTAWECMRILGTADLFNEDGLTDKLKTDAMALLEQIREGEIRISRETTTDANIAFGTAPVDAGLYKFSVAPKEVERDSVTISGYELGVDFDAEYDERYRGWVLKRFNSAISDGDDDSVTFDWSYLKQREVDSLPFVGGMIERS